MITRATDSKNDWTFGKGIQNYKRDAAALSQRIRNRLLSWKNDCFFSLDSGIDWSNYLDRGTKQFLDRDIKRTILQTEGVLQITNFASTINERSLTVSSTVETIYGEIEITETLGASGLSSMKAVVQGHQVEE